MIETEPVSAAENLHQANHFAIRMMAELDRITGTANRVIKLTQLEPAQVRDEAVQLLGATKKLQGFLHRHLCDEEDLVVPILLHHKLRG